MLGSNLNGLLFTTRPASEDGGYRFRVTERYYGQGAGGNDLSPSYAVLVKAEDVRFDETGDGFVMSLRPSAFAEVANRAENLGVSDVIIYPEFGRDA